MSQLSLKNGKVKSLLCACGTRNNLMPYTDYWHVPVTDIDAYDLTNKYIIIQHCKLLHLDYINATCSSSCPYVTVIPEEWIEQCFLGLQKYLFLCCTCL